MIEHVTHIGEHNSVEVEQASYTLHSVTTVTHGVFLLIPLKRASKNTPRCQWTLISIDIGIHGLSNNTLLHWFEDHDANHDKRHSCCKHQVSASCQTNTL